MPSISGESMALTKQANKLVQNFGCFKLFRGFFVCLLVWALFLPPVSWHLTDKEKSVSLFSVVLYVARKR